MPSCFLHSVGVLASFLMIHLNSKASEGPRLTLFQRDFLLAHDHEVTDPRLCEVVNRYFIQRNFELAFTT